MIDVPFDGNWDVSRIAAGSSVWGCPHMEPEKGWLGALVEHVGVGWSSGSVTRVSVVRENVQEHLRQPGS